MQIQDATREVRDAFVVIVWKVVIRTRITSVATAVFIDAAVVVNVEVFIGFKNNLVKLRHGHVLHLTYKFRTQFALALISSFKSNHRNFVCCANSLDGVRIL
ncbi:hypothetical protein D3C87_1656440 [compost metagenome]